jgi:hypothetical protein
MSVQVEAQRKRKRMAFSPEEDDHLRQLVAKHGEDCWRRVAAKMPKRDRRQCRERWFNYLTPFVLNGPWTPAEEALLRAKVLENGRKWKAIQPFFPGRTDINIKNHWKRLEKEEARSSHAKPNIGEGTAFDRLLTSVMGRGGGVDEAPEGGDPFEFSVFW